MQANAEEHGDSAEERKGNVDERNNNVDERNDNVNKRKDSQDMKSSTPPEPENVPEAERVPAAKSMAELQSEPRKTNELKAAELTAEELKSVESFAAHRETAVLAIMFTDLEGFTSLNDRLGDTRAIQILHEYNRHIKEVVERDGRGRQIKTLGDGTLSIFSEPSAAVERALEIQESVREINRSRKSTETLPVRIGLHMGQVTVEGGVQRDIVGSHVNRAARIESLARGGQVFITQTVYENARGFVRAPRGLQAGWKSHGHYLIRGIEEPVEVFEVGIEGETQFAPPHPGPNCRLVRSTGLTRTQQIRLIALTTLLVIASLGVILASIRFRTVRRQNQKSEQIEKILHETNLQIAPSLAEQKRMMPELPFEEGNAALEYIRIPSLRLSGKTPSLLEDSMKSAIPESASAESSRMEQLADWLVLSKVYSRLTIANNRLMQGATADLSKAIVSAADIKSAPPSPSPNCQSLSSLDAGAAKLNCAFYPDIFAAPRDVQSLPLFDLEAVSLVHRAQIARALVFERQNEPGKGALALIRLLRFNFHLSQTVNSYEELSYLINSRRFVLMALCDMHKRQGQLNDAAKWSLFLSEQTTLARQCDDTHAALFDEGYKQAHLGAKAALVLLEKCPEEFWRVQAGLSTGLTQAQKWNYFDRAGCRKALEDEIRKTAANPRLNGLFKLFNSLPPGEFPPDLSFIKAIQ